MTTPSRRDPPRPSDHSPSCPGYSPIAKYADCTCGLTTPRKSKRPTVAEATEAAIVVEQVQGEARAAADDARAAMERLIMSSGTVEQQTAPQTTAEAIQRGASLSQTIATARREIAAADPNGVNRQPRTGSGYPGGGVDRGNGKLNTDADLAGLLNNVELNVSRVLGRRVAIGGGETDGYASLVIRQRCGACRADVIKVITNDAKIGASLDSEAVRLFGVVGIEARHAYLKHRCQPIEIDGLLDLSASELEQLAQELERDGTAMVDRSIAVAKLAANSGRP